MKHPYAVTCMCARCARERLRRNTQASKARPIVSMRYVGPTPWRVTGVRVRRPIVGSAEWADTRGDDLGESPDY